MDPIIQTLDMLLNMAPAIAGNLIGGSVLVALAHHVIRLRPGQRVCAPRSTVEQRESL